MLEITVSGKQLNDSTDSLAFDYRMESFRRQLELLERDIVAMNNDRVEPSIYAQLTEAIEGSVELCREYENQIGKDERNLQKTRKEFLRLTDRFFLQSWFANRARCKPTGFPGDYEMLCKIYGDCKPASSLGAYLDHLLMDVPLACAVRGRLKLIRNFLVGEVQSRRISSRPIRILDIASGPCREYTSWPTDLPAIEVLAIDSDPHAVKYVDTSVAQHLPGSSRLKSIQYNAFRTRSSDATVQQFGRFDIIYSVGLCDYLTDEVLIKLLAAWHETLADDGVLFVAFKDSVRYDQIIYQWHLDWFFHQRTVRDVLDLYERAGFDLGNIETCRDETGIITGFVTRRNRTRRLRIEMGETTLRKPTLRLSHEPSVVNPQEVVSESASTT